MIMQERGLLTAAEMTAYALALLRWDGAVGPEEVIETASYYNNNHYSEYDRECVRDYVNDEIGDWLP